MNKSHLVKQWKKVYGEDFEKEYSGVFKKLPFHFDKKTLVRLWDKTYGEKFEKEYPQVFKLLGVKESVMKLTRSKLKEIVGEVINEASKPKAGDYVKTVYGIGQINKVRGTIAYIKLPDDTKGFWPADARDLKSTSKKEKGKKAFQYCNSCG